MKLDTFGKFSDFFFFHIKQLNECVQLMHVLNGRVLYTIDAMVAFHQCKKLPVHVKTSEKAKSPSL